MLRQHAARLLRARPRAPAVVRAVSADAVNGTTDASRRVLLVNHGYPPAYNAGSEVYTQLVARGLASRGVSAAVFSREENLLRPDFALSRSTDAGTGVPLYVVNNARAVTRFSDDRVDAAFAEVLQELRPGAYRADACGDTPNARAPLQAWCTSSI